MKKPILIKVFITLAILLHVYSCTNVMDKMINRETLEEDIEAIKLKNPDLSETIIQNLDSLLARSKGRDAFVALINKDSPDPEDSIAKYIVDEDVFQKSADTLFTYFKVHETTFTQLLSEIDKAEEMGSQFEVDISPIYLQIDQLCNEKQAEVDKVAMELEQLKESLNKMVTLKIIKITQTEKSYRDSAGVTIGLTNNTGTPIEAISFNLKLTDKLGDEVAELNCKSTKQFNKYIELYWEWSGYKHDKLIKNLMNIDLSRITTKQEINKVNLDGELISYFDAFMDRKTNFKYKPGTKLTGYCPYLEDDHALKQQATKVRTKLFAEKKEACPALSKLEELNLFDFTTILN